MIDSTNPSRSTDGEYHIRFAEIDDASRIREIEIEAGSRFQRTDLFEKLIDADRNLRTFDRRKLNELIEKQQVWLACYRNQPVGFAICSVFDNTIFLEEIDVMTAHGRRGLATQLIDRASQWAREHGLIAMDLCTFEDVAWNAPLYRKLGFELVAHEQWTDGVRAVRHEEESLGLPMERRIVMRLALYA